MSLRKPNSIPRVLGYLGASVSGLLITWAIIGLIPGVISPLDVFGLPGIRVPAAITIGGLMLAAIGFHEF